MPALGLCPSVAVPGGSECSAVGAGGGESERGSGEEKLEGRGHRES